jgi:flavin-dependent dehydrogenase
MSRDESADVVIVGARCAGSAAAIALARAGRRVVALDRSAFPSDTLSTHLFFPSHYAELARLGALERVEALGAPHHLQGGLHAKGIAIRGAYNAQDGLEHGGCVRRPGLDLALVETAREAGAEVREKATVTDVVRAAGGRVSGVRWRDRDGGGGTISASLVIGADGRRSAMAERFGSRVHHRRPNGRMMAFAYYEDAGDDGERAVATQWRAARELGTIFPCDGGQLVALVMPPVERVPEFRADPRAAFERTLEVLPLMAKRLEACDRVTKIRTSYDHHPYFRTSSGPGWALAGDAGHFKDPVIAQGIRDALRFGRLLGEAAAPALDDPDRLDAALWDWERNRDSECLDSYQWGNRLGLGDPVSPIEEEAYRWLARDERAREVLDAFARRRPWGRVFSPGRALRWTAAALRRRGADRRAVARVTVRDAGREAVRAREALGYRRRRDRAHEASAGAVSP